MLKKIFKILDQTIEISVVLIFILMVIVGGLQVFNRFILNQSLSWGEEFQKFAHIWLIFLTIPIAYQRGAHIGMQVLFYKFPLLIQKVLTFCFNLIWLTLAFVIVRYTLVIMKVTASQTSAGLGIQMSYVYSGLVIGGFYLLILSLRELIQNLINFTGTGKGA
jgi:TRAP-type C4-dicarboxylate transport system permease small subunit